MSRSEAIVVNRGELEQALREWESDAEREDWSEREDDERFRDSADYLFDKLKANKGGKAVEPPPSGDD
jgi:hypothetical protein